MAKMAKMSKVQRKSKVYIYADSHGCDHHYFSEQFKPLFTYSKRFKIQKIYAKPGCVMNQQKVQEITERATSVEPSNQVVCIFMGGNNIRRGQNRPQDVVRHYRDILDNCHTIQNCRVVFCSLIPGIGHDENSKEDFKTMNDLLSELCHSEEYNGFASFCKFIKESQLECFCLRNHIMKELI